MDRSYNKRKNYYQKSGGSNNWFNNKKKFKNYLEPGMIGFLCTCNIREKDCVRESLNILNEYADKLYGSEFQPQEKSIHSVENDKELKEVETDGPQDIEDELKEEVSNLKSVQRNPATRRFTSVDAGVKSNIFIKTTLEDPVNLAYTILNDIAETKAQKARFVLRLIPVEVTCKAKLEDIKTAAGPLFEKHFRCEPTTFMIVVNKRYNDSILRDEVIHALALLVTDRNKEHKANLKEAKFTVLVEIMKGLCCMSVLQDYKRLKHYNLAELAKPVEGDGDKPQAAADGDGSKLPTAEPEDTAAGADGDIKESDDDEDADNKVSETGQVDESGDNDMQEN